jgi:hypothetical protein
MSLKITSDKIIIQNSNNVEKFNSSQRLLYQVGYATGNSTLTSSNSWRYIPHNLNIDTDNDIVTMYITLTSGTGSVASNFINLRVPAQSPIPIDVNARAVNTRYGAVDSTWMTAYASREIAHFYAGWLSYVTVLDMGWDSEPGISKGSTPAGTNHSLGFKWEIYVYKYTT